MLDGRHTIMIVDGFGYILIRLAVSDFSLEKINDDGHQGMNMYNQISQGHFS